MDASQPDIRATAAVRVAVSTGFLEGEIASPLQPRGIIIFAHGSGSSRHSPRNRYVARALEHHGFATLLIDLLTEDEGRVDDRTAHLRFDIELLADRLVAIIDTISRRPDTSSLRIGLFGASTGGGAALAAAAERPNSVGAVVSRGGRPDLAGEALTRVAVPTLLIVGGLDTAVIRMNRDAMMRMRTETALEIVPGATHLFEEPGALEQVAALAAAWFDRHLRPGAAVRAPASRDQEAP
jgi:dienelactone hydrolase